MFGKYTQSDNNNKKAYNHVLKYTGLFGGVQGITAILSIVRNKFVAVLLGSAGMGLIDIYNHAMNLMANATQFGISTTAVRTLSFLYEKGDEQELVTYVKVIRSWSLFTAVLGFAVCAILSPFISRLSFGNYDYTLQFIMLSPVVAMLAISGVEMAILKAMRQLKKLAFATMVGAVFTLLITVPFYLIWRMQGIIPALLLSTFFVTAANLNYSLRLFKWRANPFSRTILKKGIGMVKLGLSFIFAGIVASAAEMYVRTFLIDHGSLVDEGLYCSGFILTVSYARFVFVSMDADYFPRLSAICNEPQKMNATINQQLEICVLLIAPFLIFFVLFLPYIIHLLFAESFLKVVPMALCATFYMFFKSITTPIAYTSLARGDSVVYFTMEFLYYVIFVIFIIFGYTWWGLLGCGLALSLSNLFDLIMIALVFHYRYHFNFTARAVIICISQAALLALGVWMAAESNPLYKYGIGLSVLSVSLFGSLFFLYKETTMLEIMKAKIRSFWHHGPSK